MEFKVGDRVRVINDEQYSGLIGEIIAIFKDGIDGKLWFHIDTGEEYPYHFLERQIELYEEKEEIEENKNLITLDELLERIEKLEEIVNKQNNCRNNQNNSQICKISAKNEEIISKSQLLSEDERVILRNLDKKWKWIARDENGCLCVYDKIPQKGKYTLWLVTNDYERMNVFTKGIFQFIKWTDKEPYNIEELLKGDCGNE